jgi:preprotein translocase subunit SecE
VKPSKRGIKVSAEVTTMEIKKSQQTIEQAMLFKRSEQFVGDVKAEIRKITWTNRDELFFYTKIVVLSTLLFGLSIYGLDLLIQGTLSTLSFLMHLISG